MLGVQDRILEHLSQENLENVTRLSIHQARDTLNTSFASEPPDGALRNTFDPRFGLIASPLGTTFAEALALEAVGVGLGGKMGDTAEKKLVCGCVEVRRLDASGHAVWGSLAGNLRGRHCVDAR